MIMTGRSLHEECGVFGAFGVDNAYDVVLEGLFALQHRGQEGCGIAFMGPEGKPVVDKGAGLVSEVFSKTRPRTRPGRSAIGHVRYGTSGGRELDNVQPFVFHSCDTSYAIAHNGNLVNADELKRLLGNSGSLFHSSSDSEILGHLLRLPSFGKGKITSDTLARALNLVEGAFCYLVLTEDGLYAARDKYGFRPLALGRLGEGYVVSSETCALHAVGADYLRDVLPGELITADGTGLQSRRYSHYHRNALCAMEFIYFARPDSDIEGVNVHAFRKESGRILYEENPVDADMVFGVPDSGLSPAIGYSERSGIPLEMGVIKNFYVGRTFIQPTQQMRETGVQRLCVETAAPLPTPVRLDCCKSIPRTGTDPVVKLMSPEGCPLFPEEPILFRADLYIAEMPKRAAIRAFSRKDPGHRIPDPVRSLQHGVKIQKASAFCKGRQSFGDSPGHRRSHRQIPAEAICVQLWISSGKDQTVHIFRNSIFFQRTEIHDFTAGPL